MSTPKQTSMGFTTLAGDERYAGMEERKRKRMISNRDSTRRSRMRKQKVVEDLSNEITRLRCQSNSIVAKIGDAREGYMVVSAQNNVLRAQAEEFTERLRSLISVVESVGCNLDIDDGPGALLEPWHLPCPSWLRSTRNDVPFSWGLVLLPCPVSFLSWLVI